MTTIVLGIDVAKASFDVALVGLEQTRQGQFTNDRAGFSRLGRWLANAGVAQAHACLEATNHYWEELASHLHDQGHLVSVVNPKLVKKHAEAMMRRNKSDKLDALTIADYCAKHQPSPWTPPPPAQRQLKALVRHVEALKAYRQRERNRLSAGAVSAVVTEAIEAHLAFLQQQIEALERQINDHIDQDPQLRENKELLTSIPGIGDIVAATVIAEMPPVEQFTQAGQVAAYAGLTPGKEESGVSLRRAGHLVKWGNAHLRRVLYMPALSAHQWNPIIAALKGRLQARGHKKMTIVVAVMRKLLCLCYGVLKTRRPFDPNYGRPTPAAT
jgi:transposase